MFEDTQPQGDLSLEGVRDPHHRHLRNVLTGHDGLSIKTKPHKCINTTMVKISLVMMAWSNKTKPVTNKKILSMVKIFTSHDGLVKYNKINH